MIPEDYTQPFCLLPSPRQTPRARAAIERLRKRRGDYLPALELSDVKETKYIRPQILMVHFFQEKPKPLKHMGVKI